MQAHVDVGADGDPLQRQEHRAQQRELRCDRLTGNHELREEGGKDQDGFRVAG